MSHFGAQNGKEILKIYWIVIVKSKTSRVSFSAQTLKFGKTASRTAARGTVAPPHSCSFLHKNPTFMVENDDRNARRFRSWTWLLIKNGSNFKLIYHKQYLFVLYFKWALETQEIIKKNLQTSATLLWAVLCGALQSSNHGNHSFLFQLHLVRH